MHSGSETPRVSGNFPLAREVHTREATEFSLLSLRRFVQAAPTGGACFCAWSAMQALLVSALAVAIGEIGDKTQLLALLLAARFRQPLSISGGIACATVANHARCRGMGARARSHG